MLSYRRNLLPLLVFSLLLFLFTGGITESFAQCPTISVPNPICAGDNCGAGTSFTVSGDLTGITKYVWDFGDTNTAADTSSLQYPSYRYQQAGQYTVTLTITRNGTTETCTQSVDVKQGVPQFTLSPDNNMGPQEEEICIGTTITLGAQFSQGGSLPAGATYLWSTGATTPTITVGDSVKCYSLTITDPQTGCSRTNRVNVSAYKPDPNAQQPPKEESRWYFGNNAGILFEGGQPKPDNRGKINTPEGASAVSGSDGKLLFYTDGRNVFDKNGNPMKDRNGVDVTVTANNALNGQPDATQGVLIIAQPGCNDCDPVYYIFTTSSFSSHPNGTVLSYSVVDMRLNSGVGQVTLKNQVLFQPSTERVVGVRGQPDQNNPNSQETTWIITHDFNSNVFRVYPLTPQGVGQPTTYPIGETHGPGTAAGEGYMKVYEDKLIVAIPGSPNKVQIFDFNNTTGAISNPITLDFSKPPINQAGPSPTVYGVELVQDKLYVSLNGGGTDSSKIVQFTLGDTLIQDTVQKTAKVVAKGKEQFGALQVDPYGREIYLAKLNSSSLGVIRNPTADSANINFELNGFNLGGATSQLGLPNTQPPNNRGYGQGFSFDDPPCTLENTPVTMTFRAQPDRAGGDPTKSAYDWKFYRADGSLLTSYPDAGFGVNDSVQVTFPGPGTYRASITIRNDCKTEGPPTIPDQTIVIPLSPPRPNVRDTSACAGTTIVLDAYPGRTGPAGLKYFWIRDNGQPVAGGETFNVTQGGTYRVVVTSANGECTQSDDAVVSFRSLQVTLPPQVPYCGGAAITLDAGNPGSRYEWRENGAVIQATSQILVVTPPAGTTVYSVTVTDPVLGCTATGQTTVTAGQKPRIATPTVQNTSSCGAADGRIVLTPTDPASSSDYRYQWMRNGQPIPFVPNTTADLSPLAADTYQVRVTNASGCDTTLTIAVGTDNSGITYTVPNEVQLSCGQTTGTIDIAPPPSGITLLWKGPMGNVIPTTTEDLVNQPPGVYTLTVSQGTCSNVYQSEIKSAKDQPLKPVPTFTIIGCGKAFLNAGYPGNSTNVTLTWSGPNVTDNGKDTITVSGSGSVTYTIRAASKVNPGCFLESTITVPFPPTPPDYNFGPDPAAACAGNEVLLNADQSNGWDEFVWTLPGGGAFVGSQYRANVSGTYTITVRDRESGCTDSDQVIVTIEAPVLAPAVSPSQASMCRGLGMPSFTATGQGLQWYSDPNLTKKVSIGLNTPSFTPDTTYGSRPGTYLFFVTQTINGCTSPATQVRLDVIQAPNINLGPDRTVCVGDRVTLGPTAPIAGATYLWSNGQTTQQISVNRTGNYSLRVTVGQCSFSDDITLTFVSGPKPSIPRREVPLCREVAQPSATLDAGPGAGFTYQWRRLGENTIIGNERTLTVSNLGNYTITISNEAGNTCSVVDTIRVVDKCEPNISVPDAFAPASNEAKNKVLMVFGRFVGDIEMKIYNRWGELIYSEEAGNIESLNNRAWDGTYLGKPVPAGTYVWQIKYRARDYPDREARTLRGGVLIIR